MNTKLLCSVDDLPCAAAVLRDGGMAAVPTETVYGLCVNGLNADAVAALYELKGRPEIKPLSLMVPDAESISLYCHDVPPAALWLAEEYWPGPLTLILPSRPVVPEIVRAGGSTVGLRCPAHPLTLSLLKIAAVPLAGPSANPSGSPSPKTAEEVLSYFNGKIPAVIDGGPCTLGTESTIIDLTQVPFCVLRQGALGEDAIRQALKNRLTIIGITGGTGCGKTTLLNAVRAQGALTLDCDEIYHRLLRESAALRSAIENRFGAVFSDGQLDRKKLGGIVFHDASALEDLNGITHTFITAEIDRLLEEHALRGGTLAAIDAIALFESGLADRCTKTIGVTAPREARIERIMARDSISREYAAARIDAQPTDDYYEKNCSLTLRNDGSREQFIKICGALFAPAIHGGILP